jgi:sortase A
MRIILRTRIGGEQRRGTTLNRAVSVAELWTTAIGVILLGVYGGSVIHRVVSSRLALREFDQTRAVVVQIDQVIDFSLWSKHRIRAYSENLRKKEGAPLAVLRFEKLNLRVPVFEGTDDWTLDRGAGWIKGTARLGETGNIGIAGHRDGFFRGLKDVGKGDAIELASTALTATFLVDQIEIVDPEDVAVLQPRPAPSLTLVTCYPFYFVGEAPKRFIVHATLSTLVQNLDRSL